MLIHAHDDGTADEDRWREFVTAQGFGQLVAGGRDRDLPVVVPTQFLLGDDHVILHLAKPNPIFAHLEENQRCLLSVAGDWAYIPGVWKTIGEEDPRTGIPTTYYGAVQLTCTASIVDEPAELAAILSRQLGNLEPDGEYVDPIEHGPRLRTIRGLVLAIDEVRAKFKYGGNVDEAHRAEVAAQLQRRDGPGDAAALAQMGLGGDRN